MEPQRRTGGEISTPPSDLCRTFGRSAVSSPFTREFLFLRLARRGPTRAVPGKELRVARSQEQTGQGPFTDALGRLYGLAGQPTTKRLEAVTRVSATTIEGWLKQGRTP